MLSECPSLSCLCPLSIHSACLRCREGQDGVVQKEWHPAFLKRNTTFVRRVVAKDEQRPRVWERSVFVSALLQGEIGQWNLFSLHSPLSTSRTSPLFLITLDTLASLVLSDSLFQSRKRKNLLLCYMSDYIYATNWRWSLLWLISNYSHVLLLIDKLRKKNAYQLCSISFSCLFLLLPLSFVSLGVIVMEEGDYCISQ